MTLVIIGLAGTAVMLAIPGPQESVREEGERLAARLAAARDAAIVGGRDMSIRLDANGYGVETRRGGTWMPADSRAFTSRRWLEGTSVETEPATARISFDPTGLASPTVVRLMRDGAAARVTVEAAGSVRIDAG